MSHELAYFLKANIAIALFYAFYRLFFHKDTFFKWRRAALLCFFFVSVVYPLLNIQEWVSEQEPMAAMADLYASVWLSELDIATTPIAEAFSWKSLILSSAYYAYWLTVVGLSIRLLTQFIGILLLSFRTRATLINGVEVHLLKQKQGPFSFFHQIFIYPEAHEEQELQEILTHELTHAYQWHSIDVIVSELFCIICWFNPFIWLMRREVRCNLEFLADSKVLEEGYDSKAYQYHLLRLTHQKPVATLSSSFNFLPIKSRIKMMNKKRTSRIGKTKYLMFVPLVILLLIISNIEAIARNAEYLMSRTLGYRTEYRGKVIDQNGRPVAGATIFVIDQDSPTKATNFTTNKRGEFSFRWKEQVSYGAYAPHRENSAAIITSSSSEDKERLNKIIQIQRSATEAEDYDDIKKLVFEVVEEMPQFPGGQASLMKYLRENIQNPKTPGNYIGRGIVQFVIEDDGSTNNISIVRSVTPEVDAEAVRAIANMPKWKPGRQRGKAVNVKYTVPITFLQ